MIQSYVGARRFAISATTAALILLGAPASEAAAEGSIAGTVTEEGGGEVPVPDLCVSASSASFGSVVVETADPSGDYMIPGLPADDYTVRFYTDDACPAGNFIAEYFDNKTDVDSADSVAVVDDLTTPANAQLATGGSITGTVTGPGPPPLEEICVEADDGQNPKELGRTEPDGTYTIEGLPTGDYTVHFESCIAGPLLGEFYNDQPTVDTAEEVHVVTGSPTENINAELVAGGTISGTVTDSEDTLLQDICVTARDAGFDNGREAITDIDGEYSIEGLPVGSYKVKFSSTCSSGNYASEFYNDQPTRALAEEIVVSEGLTTHLDDAVLAGAATITGTVTSPDGVEAAGYFCVASSDDELDGEVVATDEDGVYSLVGLRAGSYKISFSTCAPSDLLSEYYNDKPTRATADPVTVAEEATMPGIDAELDAAGTITGTVTGPGGAADFLEGICVEGDDVGFENGDSTVTDSDGQYTLAGLRTGSYKLQFYSCGAGNFAREFYNDKPHRASADPVSVSAGAPTPGINAELAAGGGITGTVTGPGATSLSGVCVTASDATFVSAVAQTNGAGQYAIEGLPTGSYKVQFVSCGAGNFVSEYHDDKPTKAAADPVFVTIGSTRSNIDAELEAGATIQGTVTGPGGALLAGICVGAVDGAFDEVSTQTNASGQYSLDGLRAGSYKLEFSSCGPGNFAGEFWENKSTRAAADPIDVAAGSTIDKDAELATGGRITGTVTAAGGTTPLDGVCVSAFDVDTLEGGEPVLTDTNGQYAIEDLRSDLGYKVLFESCAAGNYAYQWYSGQATVLEAQSVPVTGGETTGIDAVLDPGGSISGVVTDANGTVAGACVRAFDPTAQQFSYSSTESGVNGTYTLDGLASGSFKVYFEGACADGNLDDEYYDDAEDYASGEPVEVPAPGEGTPDIDAELAWLVAAPTVTIASGPSGETTDRRPVFGFDATPGAIVECSVATGAASYEPCSDDVAGHRPATDLANGSYTFAVRATNAGGSDTDTRSFSVTSPATPPPSTPPPSAPPPSEPPVVAPPPVPGGSIACAIAKQKLTNAKALVKKAKKSHIASKVKKAKTKLRKAKAAVGAAC